MSSHLARTLLALLIVSSPVHAQGVEYAPGTTRYRITTNTSVAQSSPMGNQTFDVGVRQLITVNLMKRAKDTVMAALTVDSISMTGAPPGADVGKLAGSKFVSMISPTGKFYSSKSPEGLDPQLAQLAEGVGRFMPAYHGDLAVGKTWSDTLSGKVPQNGMMVDRTSISDYAVSGDTSIAGETAFKVQRTTTVKAGGTGSMQGTAVTMETTGTSTGQFLLTHTGVYLGGDSKDDVLVKIMMTAQGAEITLKQNQRTSVEAVR
ncbi:MAG: hypothetical protein JWM95_5414 [Gemmatimonadetes bacterium]|nr:hypothetical protein [Gemmatimonadota bacterium]